MAWIERQTEINWRFQHIYSLVSWQHMLEVLRCSDGYDLEDWFCEMTLYYTKVGKNVNRTGRMPHAESESVYRLTGHSQHYKFCFSGYFSLTIQTQLMESH